MLRELTGRAFLAATLLMSSITVASAATAITSTFDDGDEGWTVIGNATGVEFNATGGNPGGFIEVNDASVGGFSFVAPDAFLGDLSSFEGGTLSFDTFDDSSKDVLDSFGVVSIAGAGGVASLDLFTGPLGDTFQTVSAALTADVWGVTEETWQAILADVTAITLVGESVTGITEQVGLDNFAVSSVAPVPLPASLSFMLAGLGGLVVMRRRRKAA